MPRSAPTKTAPETGSFSHSLDALGSTIERTATALQQECIRRTGSTLISYTRLSRRTFHPPPLRVTSVPVNLYWVQSIPFQLYGHTTYSPAELVGTWDLIAKVLLSKGFAGPRVFGLAASAFPSVPFVGDADGLSAAVQYLCAMSWHAGELQVRDAKQTLIHLNGMSIGLDGPWVLRTNGPRRRQRPPVSTDNRVLTTPLGRHVTAPAKVGALYDFLRRNLPETAEALPSVFGAAVAAGKEYTERLTNPFDLVMVACHDDVATRVPAAWNKARALVERSPRNCLRGLARLLMPRLGHDTFVRLFGNPYRDREAMRPETRRRLLETIDRLHNQSIVVAGGDEPGKTSRELQGALELQQLIGGVHA